MQFIRSGGTLSPPFNLLPQPRRIYALLERAYEKFQKNNPPDLAVAVTDSSAMKLDTVTLVNIGFHRAYSFFCFFGNEFKNDFATAKE
jgi:hypothetical protein